MYRVGTFIFSARAKASVDLPTPGAAANIDTSLRLRIILFDSNALKHDGNGSPPILARPTLLTSVRKAYSFLVEVVASP